jgi:Ankyrin repeats (3 copies)/NACHT domain
VVLHREVRDWALHCWKSEALRLSTRRERAIGTCEWILTDEKFLQWRDTIDTSLLWVSGSPGAGKSILSSAIIDSLEADTRGRKTVAYYFIDGRFESSSTALDILLAITVKMLSREISGESRGHLNSLLNDLDAAGEEMSSSQVGEFLLRIRHNLSSEETLYLIIDGLDEAKGSQNTRDSLQEIIYQGNQYNRWHPMKLFVSSRSDFLIHKHITGALHVDIDQEAFVQKDLTIYINQSLEEIQLSQISQLRYSVETRFEGALNDFEVIRATSAAPSFFETQEIGQLGATCIHTARDYHRDELVRRISAYASGTFLWVRLWVAELSKASFSQVSVDHLLDGHITDDLFGIYEHMIRAISEKDRPVALQMLRWVTYAARPLSGGELLSAIALQTNIKLLEADIQRVCGGLLRSSNSGVVSLVHLTLQDFLESRSGGNDVLGWRPVSDASNEMIAHICLKVLGSELFLESLDILTAIQNTRSTNIRRFDALESYAYHNWKFHYTCAEHQSSYLPGMLHEKFRKAWENGAFAPSSAFAPAAIRMDEKSGENQNHLKNLQWASDEPLNAGLRAGARYGMIKLVKLQLQMGVSPNVVDVGGNTPLHYAAAAGNLEMMRLLIQYGANVQAVSEAGETALHSAIANGQSEGVKLLLKAGARPFDISTRSSHDQFAQILNRNTPQKLYLVVALSEICAACGDLQSHYIVSSHCILLNHCVRMAKYILF